MKPNLKTEFQNNFIALNITMYSYKLVYVYVYYLSREATWNNISNIIYYLQLKIFKITYMLFTVYQNKKLNYNLKKGLLNVKKYLHFDRYNFHPVNMITFDLKIQLK